MRGQHRLTSFGGLSGQYRQRRPQKSRSRPCKTQSRFRSKERESVSRLWPIWARLWTGSSRRTRRRAAAVSPLARGNLGRPGHLSARLSQRLATKVRPMLQKTGPWSAPYAQAEGTSSAVAGTSKLKRSARATGRRRKAMHEPNENRVMLTQIPGKETGCTLQASLVATVHCSFARCLASAHSRLVGSPIVHTNLPT